MAERETMGQRLRKAREALGLSVAELREKIDLEFRGDVGDTTIRELERDKPPNPGIKTVELVCRGLGLEPLDVIALAMDEELEDASKKMDRDLAKTRFHRLLKAYAGATSRERLLVDDNVQMWIERLTKKS